MAVTVRRTLLEQIDLELDLRFLLAQSTQARLDYALLLHKFICENEADPGLYNQRSGFLAQNTPKFLQLVFMKPELRMQSSTPQNL